MRLTFDLDLPTHDLRIGQTRHSSVEPGRSLIGHEGREFKRFYPLIISLEALTKINEWQWQRAQSEGVTLPLLYDAGVRYVQEQMTGTPKEDWQDVVTLYRAKRGDCEDLACARAAELRFHGVPAVPCLRYKQLGKITLVHIMVLWPDGFLEDPSKRLGMEGEY